MTPAFDPPAGLFVSGSCPEGDGTVLLLSPDEAGLGGPRFWAVFTAAPEFADGAPDPLDRWSKRVIAPWAAALGGRALFPSEPPYPPFTAWALRSGQCRTSPIGMLVHARCGLFISFRGAVLIPARLPEPAPAPDPCAGCARPCLSACPAATFTPAYAVERCHDWLDRPEGKDCRSTGCLVRRACPASRGCGRLAEQSAWHMRAFHP